MRSKSLCLQLCVDVLHLFHPLVTGGCGSDLLSLMKIHDGKYRSMNTCDYCFAAKEEESGFHNVISQGLTFMACSGCKVVHYCSKVSV